jgi:hypothetical protein
MVSSPIPKHIKRRIISGRVYYIGPCLLAELYLTVD